MVVILFALVFCSGLAGLPPSEISSGLPAANLQDEILSEVNTLRAAGCRCGSKRMAPAPPLQWNDRLEEAARRHVRDMAGHHRFDHIGSDGSSTGDRAAAAGYQWTFIAENIANGYPTPAAVVAGWRQSKGHCLNMMAPQYTDMGAAYLDGYWVQVLGRK